jgi:hypothetical protein
MLERLTLAALALLLLIPGSSPASGRAQKASPEPGVYGSLLRLPGVYGLVEVRYTAGPNNFTADVQRYSLSGADAAAWSQSYREAMARGATPALEVVVDRVEVTWRGPCDPETILVDLSFRHHQPEIPKGVGDAESRRRWELFEQQLFWRLAGTLWHLKEGAYRLEHFLSEHRCDPRAALDVAIASVQPELDRFLARQVPLDDTGCLDLGVCRPKPTYRLEDQPVPWPTLGVRLPLPFEPEPARRGRARPRPKERPLP